MATASGVAVANLYYNQPMLADMGRSFHASAHYVGLIATATQIGYALGMPLFIPLGDFVERRRMVVILFCAVALALAATALAPTLWAVIAASFLIGLTTVIAQILIPFATELASPAEQGRTVGAMLTGVLLGILLARTVSGAVAQHFGWRAMFWVAAAGAIACSGVLRSRLPAIPPRTKTSYSELMRSIWALVKQLPKLRQVSFVAAMFFAAFSAFWTTLVFFLETPPYHYGPQVAGLFGLVGAVGASAAPISGRLSDRRSPRFVIAIALGIVMAAFGVLWLFGLRLWGLILGVILLDMGVQAAQVANQTRVLSLRPDARNRVNTVYMIGYFSGGSLGSAVGSWSWSKWHWTGVCATGLVLMVLRRLGIFREGRLRRDRTAIP